MERREQGKKRAVGKEKKKSFATVVKVLYWKEEGAWVGTVVEYRLLLNIANV
jgi:hypothetical protein